MQGTPPAVALVNPKYGHNAGGAYRACAAWGMRQLWISGRRLEADITGRLPREERMRIYKEEVSLHWSDRFFDEFPADVTPVAVEVLPSAEPLTHFQHPERALYVFGPEDGSIPPGMLRHCHRFVIIPSDHCLNLAAAVNCVLMHRRMTRQLAGEEPLRAAADTLFEERGIA